MIRVFDLAGTVIEIHKYNGDLDIAVTKVKSGCGNADHKGIARVSCLLRAAPVELYLFMPTEISIPDAEDLKSRVRELRRFL